MAGIHPEPRPPEDRVLHPSHHRRAALHADDLDRRLAKKDGVATAFESTVEVKPLASDPAFWAYNYPDLETTTTAFRLRLEAEVFTPLIASGQGLAGRGYLGHLWAASTLADGDEARAIEIMTMLAEAHPRPTPVPTTLAELVARVTPT